MRVITLISLVVLFVVVSEARWAPHHHLHHKQGASVSYPTCHFMSDKGTYDMRLFMRDLQGKDWELTSATSEPGSVFYYNPCTGVSHSPCPKDSALCQITPKNEAISFGNVSTIQWTEVDGGVELAYSNGEMCNNGKPRTTVVHFTCSEPNAELSTHLTTLDNIVVDECTVTVTVTSMYGCPAEQLCSVFDQPSCEHSDGLCEYNKKDAKCVMNAESCTRIGHHHLSHGAIIGICVAAFSLLLCTCTCCALGCRKRRQRLARCRSKKAHHTSRRVNKKVATPVVPAPVTVPVTVDEESVVPLQEQQQAVYIPMQQPVQFFYNPQQNYYTPYALSMPPVGPDQLANNLAMINYQDKFGHN